MRQNYERKKICTFCFIHWEKAVEMMTNMQKMNMTLMQNACVMNAKFAIEWIGDESKALRIFNNFENVLK